MRKTKTLILIFGWTRTPTLWWLLQHLVQSERYRVVPESSACTQCCSKFKASKMSAGSWCFQKCLSHSAPAAGVSQQTASVSCGPAVFPFNISSPFDVNENCMTLIQMERYSVITVFFSLSDMWLSYKKGMHLQQVPLTQWGPPCPPSVPSLCPEALTLPGKPDSSSDRHALLLHLCVCVCVCVC